MMPLAGSLADAGLLLPGIIIAAIALLGAIAEGIAAWHRRQAAGISDVKDVLLSVRQVVGQTGATEKIPISLGEIREIEGQLADLIKDVNDRKLSGQLETVLITFRLVFMCPNLQGCSWDMVERSDQDPEGARQAALLRLQRAQECLEAVEAARQRLRRLWWWTR
jgi:hypothetical protein